MNEMSAPHRRRHVRAAPHLRVPFGHRLDNGAPVVWDNKQAINGHMLISGPSGTGKTFQLNRLIASFAQQGVSRIHVLNVHGDLCDGMPEDQVQTVRFSEQSPYGLQPLELLDDPDLGGVRRRALAFIALMARQGALGQRQRPALFRLLVKGYRRFGFYADVPTAWGLDHDPHDRPSAAKRFSTLRDLKDSVWRWLVMMKMGQTQTTTAALEKVVTLAKWRAQLRKRLKTAEGDEHDKIEAVLVKARSEASEAFTEGLEQIDAGTELEEFILWNKADGVPSPFDRLEGLDNSGIFRGPPPTFPRGVTVHDYNIFQLVLTDAEVGELEARTSRRQTAPGLVEQARIVLVATEGGSYPSIGAQLGVDRITVSK